MKNGSEQAATITLTLTEYQALKDENLSLKQDLEYVKFQLAKLQKMLFASKSERLILPDPAQLALGFNVET